MANKLKELGLLDVTELKKRVDQERMALAQMRINASATQVKDYSQYRKKRVTIARLLTMLRSIDG